MYVFVIDCEDATNFAPHGLRVSTHDSRTELAVDIIEFFEDVEDEDVSGLREAMSKRDSNKFFLAVEGLANGRKWAIYGETGGYIHADFFHPGEGTTEAYAVGDVVFWHDPDRNVGSGVGKILRVNFEVIQLEMISGSFAEVLPHEITPVKDCEVVGVDENDDLLYYNAETHSLYMDGIKADSGEHDLSDEEKRRVKATRESMDQ